MGSDARTSPRTPGEVGGAAAVVAGVLVLLAGCADRGPTRFPVKGRVTYHGQPVTGGWISFTRLDPVAKGLPVRPATGELGEDGCYTMKTFGSDDGVMPGKYAVSIVAIDYERAKAIRDPRQPQPFTIPERYTRPETSGLTVVVPQEVTEPLQFDFALTDR